MRVPRRLAAALGVARAPRRALPRLLEMPPAATEPQEHRVPVHEAVVERRVDGGRGRPRGRPGRPRRVIERSRRRRLVAVSFSFRGASRRLASARPPSPLRRVGDASHDGVGVGFLRVRLALVDARRRGTSVRAVKIREAQPQGFPECPVRVLVGRVRGPVLEVRRRREEAHLERVAHRPAPREAGPGRGGGCFFFGRFSFVFFVVGGGGSRRVLVRRRVRLEPADRLQRLPDGPPPRPRLLRVLAEPTVREGEPQLRPRVHVHQSRQTRHALPARRVRRPVGPRRARRVDEEEAALAARVRVHVDEKIQAEPRVPRQPRRQRLRRVERRELIGARGDPVPVQIAPPRVRAVVPPEAPVRVEHRDDGEGAPSPKRLGRFRAPAQIRHETPQRVARRRLPGVHAAAQHRDGARCAGTRRTFFIGPRGGRRARKRFPPRARPAAATFVF